MSPPRQPWPVLPEQGSTGQETLLAVAASLQVTQIHKAATAGEREISALGSNIWEENLRLTHNPMIWNILASCSLGRKSSQCLPRTQRGTFQYPQGGLCRQKSPGLTRTLIFTSTPYKHQLKLQILQEMAQSTSLAPSLMQLSVPSLRFLDIWLIFGCCQQLC